MSENTDCVALHQRQNLCPRIRNPALAPVADYVGLEIENLRKPADTSRCFDGLVKNIHSGQSITKVSRVPISFEVSAFEAMKTIAERLVFARKSKGKSWTQRHLAIAAGVSTGMIGNMEIGIRGAKGSIPGTLPQIANALGVRFDWLAYGTGEMVAQGTAEAATPGQAGERFERWLNKIKDRDFRERTADAAMQVVYRALDQQAGLLQQPSPEQEPQSKIPRASRQGH